MDIVIPKNKFNIGQIVYHITPESDPGVILDIRYTFKGSYYSYIVALGFNAEVVCTEEELSDSRIF